VESKITINPPKAVELFSKTGKIYLTCGEVDYKP
jgi:hypothetical protein